MKSKLITLIIILSLSNSLFAQFLGGVQDGYASRSSLNNIQLLTIQTGIIKNSPFCAGASITVSFTTDGTFTTGNTFYAEMSDGMGSFASPDTIGFWVGDVSGTINCVIPTNTPTGAGYRFRVVGDLPHVIGTDNGIDITINALPIVDLVTFIDTCVNTSPFAMFGGTPPGGTYTGPGVNIFGIFNPAVAGVGTHLLTYTYDNGTCVASDTQSVYIFPAPVVTLNTFTDTCDNTAPFALYGGSPAGGTYSGPGVDVFGNFDPSIAGPSPTITYDYTDGNGCSGSASQNVTIFTSPTVTLDPFANVCSTASPFALTGGLPAGGNYSGTGVISNWFYPSISGTGTFAISYVFIDGNGCSDTATQNISVYPLVAPTLNPFVDTCITVAPFAMYGGLPLGGTYSGTGVDGLGVFDPSIAGAGTFPITYTYTDTTSGCSSSVTENVTVNPLPIVTLSTFVDTCENVLPFVLYGGFPTSPGIGSYSGTGVISDWFDPAMAGPGSFVITYTYSDLEGCTNFATQSVTVLASPVVTLGAFADVCIDVSPFALSGGSPLLGTYSGPGVDGFGNFDPAVAGVGTHTITYTYTNGSGCVDFATQTITVHDLPVVTLLPFNPICLNTPIFALSGGSPFGGTYSGVGVVGGNFDPSVSGLGTFTITYSYTDGNSCTNIATQNITVNAVPVVTLSTFIDTCLNTTPFQMYGGSPLGGTYSGSGILADTLYPVVAGVGSHLVTYTFTDINSCTSFATQTVDIDSLPTVTLNTFIDTCIDAGIFALTGGLPLGGTYTGTGVDGFGNFDPMVAGVGTFVISYSWTDGNGCTSIATQNVAVNDLPIVSLSTFTDTCFEVTPFALFGGLPLGGTYSGPGVNLGVFDPAVAGAGVHVITYTYMNNEGCINFATANVTVVASPVVSLVTFVDTCVDVPAFPLTGGWPTGGVYTGNGVDTLGNFDPAVSGAGSFVITYTFLDTITGCSNFATDTVIVNPLPVVTLTTFLDTCVDVTPFALYGGLPNTGGIGVYSGLGVDSLGIFNPSLAGIGPDTLTYTFTDTITGCSSFATQIVMIDSLPIPDAGPDITICWGVDTMLTATGGVAYLWSPAAGLNAVNIPNPIASPDSTTTYIVTVFNAQGCSRNDTMVLTVNPLPIPSAGADTIICFSDSIQLIATGGIDYVWTPPAGLSNDSIFNPMASPSETTTYTVTVTNANGCSATSQITIGVKPLPFVDLSSDALNNEIYLGDVITFTSTPSGYVNYQFYVNETSAVSGTENIYATNSLSQGNSSVYVVVTNNGCANTSDTLSVKVKPFPNAFTPNGDGINDVFLKGLELKVFNRWGQELYKGVNGWDGMYMGKRVATETYYYEVILYNLENQKTIIKGSVTIADKY